MAAARPQRRAAGLLPTQAGHQKLNGPLGPEHDSIGPVLSFFNTRDQFCGRADAVSARWT